MGGARSFAPRGIILVLVLDSLAGICVDVVRVGSGSGTVSKFSDRPSSDEVAPLATLAKTLRPREDENLCNLRLVGVIGGELFSDDGNGSWFRKSVDCDWSVDR